MRAAERGRSAKATRGHIGRRLHHIRHGREESHDSRDPVSVRIKLPDCDPRSPTRPSCDPGVRPGRTSDERRECERIIAGLERQWAITVVSLQHGFRPLLARAIVLAAFEPDS
jgi:hypothetical protein